MQCELADEARGDDEWHARVGEPLALEQAQQREHRDETEDGEDETHQVVDEEHQAPPPGEQEKQLDESETNDRIDLRAALGR